MTPEKKLQEFMHTEFGSEKFLLVAETSKGPQYTHFRLTPIEAIGLLFAAIENVVLTSKRKAVREMNEANK